MNTLYYENFNFGKEEYILAGSLKGLSFVGNSFSQLEDFFPNTNFIKNNESMENYWSQIHEYLLGKRQEFTLKLDISGTKFQESVWEQLKKIPYGQTSNYTKVAQAIGNPKAVRAVGSAVGRNPVLIVVPCHRVITKSRQLGNYRGGLAMKRELLTLEGAIVQ